MSVSRVLQIPTVDPTPSEPDETLQCACKRATRQWRAPCESIAGVDASLHERTDGGPDSWLPGPLCN